MGVGGTVRRSRLLRGHREALSPSLSRLVEAVCYDTPRREKAVRDKTERSQVLRHYESLNRAVRDALALFPEVDGEVLLSDVGEKRGRTRSPQHRLSPSAYATVKRRFKVAVARRLRLV